MVESQPMLEYEYTPPQELDGVHFSVGRALAFGYIAACTFGLILMGIIMAMQV